MSPIALLVLLYCQGPIYREPSLRLSVEDRRSLRGREARFNASTGTWQIFDGGQCVGEVATQEEAITRVSDPSACLSMGPDRFPVIT